MSFKKFITVGLLSLFAVFSSGEVFAANIIRVPPRGFIDVPNLSERDRREIERRQHERRDQIRWENERRDHIRREQERRDQ